MRKVERAPNLNAKKRAETLAYGGGQRFGPGSKNVGTK